MLEEPVHARLEAREALQGARLEGERGVERHEADQAVDWQLSRRPGTPGDDVAEEAFVLVPERLVVVAGTAEVHRVGDEEEVLEELGGNVLVDVVVLGELEGDVQPARQAQSTACVCSSRAHICNA